MFIDKTTIEQMGFTVTAGLPEGYKGLLIHGSQAETARCSAGLAVRQQFMYDHVSIELSFFHFVQNIEVALETRGAFAHLLAALENSFSYFTGASEQAEIITDHFLLMNKPAKNMMASFKGDQRYFLLDIHCAGTVMKGLRDCFQALQSKFMQIGPGWMGAEAKDELYKLFKAEHREKRQRYYFEKKVGACLFQMFVQQEINEQKPAIPQKDDEQKIANLEKLVAGSLGEYLSVSDLSKKAMMNENKMQSLFQRKYGKTVVEYKRVLRLKESKRLIIEEQMQIKEVYSRVGYDSITGFISEFKKYFGYPPGSLKDKK